jgi:phage tail sheath gpL-like
MADDDLEPCESEAEAITLTGRGSELHLAARGFFEVNPAGVLYLGTVSAGVGTSTRDLVFATDAAADGFYIIYLDGNKYTLTITSGDGIDDMANNLEAGLQAQGWYQDLPFTCASDNVDTVTFTTKNLGPQSQWALEAIAQNALLLPGTTSATLGATTASVGADPTVANIITDLGSARYDYQGWTALDSTAITAIEAYTATQIGPTVGKLMQNILCSPDSYANSVTTAQTNSNYRYTQVVWSQTNKETWAETLGRIVGLRSKLEEVDPAQPYVNEKIPGYRIHSSNASYPSSSNIENGLNNSLSPIGVDGGDGVLVMSITSYSLNGSNPDFTTYNTQAVTVPFYMADTLDTVMSARLLGKKVAEDYTEPTDTPKGVVTPRMVKDIIYQELKRAQEQAIVSEITDTIKDMIDAEIDSSDSTRINFECPVPWMRQLSIIAGNVRGI